MILPGLFTCGRLFQLVKEIIQSSAQFGDELPQCPELSDWTEVVTRPFGQLLRLVMVCFGPALAVSVWMPFGLRDRWAIVPEKTLVRALLVMGMLVFPMALLARAMADDLAALNPLLWLGSILRIPGPHLMAAVLFEAVMFLYLHVPDWLQEWLPVLVLSQVAG